MSEKFSQPIESVNVVSRAPLPRTLLTDDQVSRIEELRAKKHLTEDEQHELADLVEQLL